MVSMVWGSASSAELMAAGCWSALLAAVPLLPLAVVLAVLLLLLWLVLLWLPAAELPDVLGCDITCRLRAWIEIVQNGASTMGSFALKFGTHLAFGGREIER